MTSPSSPGKHDCVKGAGGQRPLLEVTARLSLYVSQRRSMRVSRLILFEGLISHHIAIECEVFVPGQLGFTV